MFEIILRLTSGGLDSPEQCKEERLAFGGTKPLPLCGGRTAVEKGRGRPAPLLQTIPWADQSGRQSMREHGVETGSWKPIHLWGPGVTEPLDGGEPHQLMESRGHQAARQQG